MLKGRLVEKFAANWAAEALLFQVVACGVSVAGYSLACSIRFPPAFLH
jgi:hypothetical protein